MDRLRPLPECVDPVALHHSMVAGAARVADRLRNQEPPAESLAAWRPGGLDKLAASLAPLAEAAFPADGGEPDLQPAREVMRRLATDGARQKLPAEQAVRLAIESDRDISEVLCTEAARIVDDPLVLEAVAQRITAVASELATEYLTAFLAETGALLAEQEELGAHVLATARAGFALGDTDGRVVYANDAFGRHFRGPCGDLIGLSWRDVLGFDDVDDAIDSLRGGESVWREVESVDHSGVKHVMRVSLHEVGGRVQAVAVDVTFEHRFQRLRGELMQGLIHDLRSPLSVVSGWAHTLLTDGNRLDEGTRRSGLESIQKAARHLASMTENMLELELLEAGSAVHDPVPFCPLERIQSVLTQSKAAAALHVTEETAVHADVDAFDRIVRNLLANSQNHGIPPIEITIGRDDDSVRIDVADCGKIDSQVVANAFGGRVRSASGFGIGLRTTFLLARSQGGELDLTSTDPTTFTLWLPTAG